jgi:hypothetical protein
VIGATKDLITDTAQHWKENETSSAALAKGLVDGAILDNGTTEEDCYWAHQRGAFAAQAGLEKATGIAHEFYANMFVSAGQKVGWERTGMQTLAVAGHAATFVGTVVAGTAIDLAKFGTEINSIARNYGAAKAAFANGDYKTGLRATGQMIGGVTKELSRATVVFSAAGVMRTAGKEAVTVGANKAVVVPVSEQGSPKATAQVVHAAEDVKALPAPSSQLKLPAPEKQLLLAAPEKKAVQEVEKTVVEVSGNVKLTTNGRIDYSKGFKEDIEATFVAPSVVRHENVMLSEDLFLVQFHNGAPVGERHSLRFWTTVSQAHDMSTIDDVLQKLALLPEWGQRTHVSVAIVPKGSVVTYAEGLAEKQTSRILSGEIRSGGGVQYLFKDFDPGWVVQTRRIEGVAS